MPSTAKQWVLSQDAFDALLDCLDADRGRAAQKYEKIRCKLISLFEWRGCPFPEEYADIAIDRVAKRVHEGTELQQGSSYAFFHGVALNMMRELWRGAQTDPQRSNSLPDTLMAGPHPDQILEEENARKSRDIQLECLDDCVAALEPETRRLLNDYHSGEGRALITNRQNLAGSLNVSARALRIRVHRIRARLESCVEACAKAVEETNSGL